MSEEIISLLTPSQKYTLCQAMAVAGFGEETSGAYSNAFNWLDIEEPDDFDYVDGEDNEIYQKVEGVVIQKMFLQLYFCVQYRPEEFNDFCERSKPWAWTIKRLSKMIEKKKEINDESLQPIVSALEDWD